MNECCVRISKIKKAKEKNRKQYVGLSSNCPLYDVGQGLLKMIVWKRRLSGLESGTFLFKNNRILFRIIEMFYFLDLVLTHHKRGWKRKKKTLI